MLEMMMSLVLLVFYHKPKHWTNKISRDDGTREKVKGSPELVKFILRGK